MRFLCRYIGRKIPGEYYRTVHADGINEAAKIAGRYTKKGYLLVSVVEAR